MTRDGDIPTIFNPRGRNRAPSVLVTDEGVANGPFAHADSVSSQQEPIEIASPTAPTGLAAKLKSCSVSLCSKSARKVSRNIDSNTSTRIGFDKNLHSNN
jgi:hypothetical protein